MITDILVYTFIAVFCSYLNGCDDDDDDEPAILTLNSDSVKINHATNNNNDGSIHGISGVRDSKEPFWYQWFNNTTGKPIYSETRAYTPRPLTDVPAGTYKLGVRDIVSNVKDPTGYEVFVINSINTMEITTITITDATNGMLDGSIQVNIDHGTLPYKYIWNEKESNAIIYDFTTDTLIDVPAGTYTLTVSDSSDPVQSISKDIIIQNTNVDYAGSSPGQSTTVDYAGSSPGQSTNIDYAPVVHLTKVVP